MAMIKETFRTRTRTESKTFQCKFDVLLLGLFHVYHTYCALDHGGDMFDFVTTEQ